MYLKKTYIWYISFIFIICFTGGAYAEKGYIELENISHNISSQGEISYRINAEKGYIENFSSDEFILDKIKVLWFEDGNISLKTTALKGFLDKKTGNIKLEEQIRAVSKDYKIYCNSLLYNNTDKIIYLSGNIKLISNTGTIVSDKGKLDTATGVVTLTQRVKGDIQ